MAQGQTGAGLDEARVPLGDGDGDATPDERPLPRSQCDRRRRDEVEPGIALAGIGREREVRVQAPDLDVDAGPRHVWGASDRCLGGTFFCRRPSSRSKSVSSLKSL